jgi:sugar (pentulose or hexulose) kinase
MFVLGLDIGTQGVRGVIADAKGNVWADCSESFAAMNVLDSPSLKEQHPDDWWDKTRMVIAECIREIEEKGYKSGDIVSLAVDGTSGTILLVDGQGEALTNGIMYNDSRSGEQAKAISAVAGDHEAAHGYRFNSSYALPKILWLKQNLQDLYGRAACCIHQTDYIVGKLTGNFYTTDYSNALKTGYDLFHERWGDFIPQTGLDTRKLPEVVPPGEKITCISEKAAGETGLSTHTVVAAGATDGYASAFSAGAVRPGEWASIIGTTFVLKGVTREFIRDSQGRVYSHKHPEGYYMPGGASNAGGSVLNEVFGKENFSRLDKRVLELIPTQILVYPLSGRGERFPFVNPDAERFVVGIGAESELYTAYMEGVGYVEKMSYSVMESLGCSVGSEIYAVGGATKSGEWLKIRASILNKTLKVPKVTNAAMGSAMIAASKTLFGTITEAADSMLLIEKTVKPFDDLVPQYENLYEEFVFQCQKIYGV